MAKYVVEVEIDAETPSEALWNLIFDDVDQPVKGVTGFSVQRVKDD